MLEFDIKRIGDVVDSIRFVYDRHKIGGRLGEHRRNYSYKILEVQNTTKNIPGKNIPFDNNKELALPAGVIFGGSSDYFDSLGEYELIILGDTDNCSIKYSGSNFVL
ncbi:7045_t:CDS:2 [Entrophospora sp. SA101]|nr:8720_t:CDS:2 [Entrophospora sp. SA101]CAJ0830258.1 7045_t:CDS:2 [Entrophospora sp. SA101]